MNVFDDCRTKARVSVPLLAAAVLLVAASDAAAQAAPPFPVLEERLFLSAGQALQDDPGASGQTIFLPVLDVLGLGMNEAAWAWEGAWNHTYAVPQDTIVTLHFAAVDLRAVGDFTVELSSVAPDGTTTLLGSRSHSFTLPSVPGSTEEFVLGTAGGILPAGHGLRLGVRADDLNVLTVLQYGGSTPSGLALPIRLLDSDLDGVPDDADACPLERDCDGDGTDDGGEDDDGDGVSNHFEFRYYTNVTDADSDDDGVPDGEEDDDGDGCDARCEDDQGTDPSDPDTDDDGIPDGEDDTPAGGGGGPRAASKDGSPSRLEPPVASALFACGSALVLLALLGRF